MQKPQSGIMTIMFQEGEKVITDKAEVGRESIFREYIKGNRR